MQQIKERFDQFLSTQLNNEQQKAVTQKKGAILVIAGAGSGKTRVITTRIAHLILKEQVNPHSIIALTFTNKAAKEMQERITHFLGNTRQLPFIGTFHSYCLRLLKANQEKLDTPFFSILDEDDQHKILQGIVQRNGLQKEFTPKNLSYQISHIKNNASDADAITALFAIQPKLESIYKAYEQEKKASKCLDFDDLLLEALKLFRTDAAFKKEMQETVQHILVDEYQDTNVVQHELLKHLAKNKSNKFAIESLCVVGDEDQSIYSWRGATIANIINFKHDFPQAITIKIEQNYRSVQSILDVANQVIQNNKQRNPKSLWSDKKGHDRIRILTCLSEYQEGDAIAHLLQTVGAKQKLNTIAILYRTHFQSRAIEEALIRNSIPYRIIGGVQFYERKEIRDMLAYLRLIVNPFDRASFFRVINAPSRGLGEKFEELFYNHWHHETFLTFPDVAKKIIADGFVTGLKKTALESFIAIFKNTHAQQKTSQALDHIIIETSYLAYLKEQYEPEDAQSRIENIKELLNAVKHFESNNIATISQFLDEVALMQEKMSKQQAELDAVTLMTLHAAKGLEFDTIILTGLEQGLLPSSRSLGNEASLEEERRLFYVGITRARERLLITHSRYRYAYRNMTDQMPSWFLQEIPRGTINQQDCSYWKASEFKHYFSQWFGTQRPAFVGGDVITFGSAQKNEMPIIKKMENSVLKRDKQPMKNKDIKPASPLRNSKAVTLAPFKVHQSVQHAKFGTGLVTEIEEKANNVFFITVNFKTGKKKLDSKFLMKI